MAKKDTGKVQIYPPAICYALSDQGFINAGWTALPVNKIMLKESTYNTKPLKTDKDWFSEHLIRGDLLYPTGEVLVKKLEDDVYKIFYRNGQIAIHIQNYKFENASSSYRRYVLRDDSAVVLGIIDSLCRGIVYDKAGNVRLKYNQYEGILYDRGVGPPRNWRWNREYTKPKYEYVFYDTYISPPDEKMLLLLAKQVVKGEKITEKPKPVQKRLSKYLPHFKDVNKEPTKVIKIRKQTVTPLPLKPVTVKINTWMSLRILNQRQIHLTFDCGVKTIKLELGVVLTNELIDKSLINPGRAASIYEQVPPNTPSLTVLREEIVTLKDNIKKAKKHNDRVRAELKCYK